MIFADIFVLAQRFGKGTLLRQSEVPDVGFDFGLLAQMMRTIGRFADDQIPLPPSDLTAAK